MTSEQYLPIKMYLPATNQIACLTTKKGTTGFYIYGYGWMDGWIWMDATFDTTVAIDAMEAPGLNNKVLFDGNRHHDITLRGRFSLIHEEKSKTRSLSITRINRYRYILLSRLWRG